MKQSLPGHDQANTAKMPVYREDTLCEHASSEHIEEHMG
jgi:hypothetical protein